MERIWLARLHCNLQDGHPKERVVNTHTYAHICSGVLHFVGLKPQKEERLHWDAVQQSIRENRLKQMKTSSPSMMSMQSPTTGGLGRRGLAPVTL